MKTRYLIYLLPLILLAACEPKVDEFTPTKGNADFSRYIAVGDFWTCGYADASLYKSGQENSYPNILASQFKSVGGGEFKQPLMVDDYGFGLTPLGTTNPKLVLDYRVDCKGATSLAPGYANVPVDPANFASVAAKGPFNNISMPGLKSIYIAVPGFAVANPYFGRFATAQTNTVLQEIPSDGTFFTLWLGNFDILYYAMLGGVGDQITPADQFTAAMTATLATLTAGGAKGAVANLPDFTDAAFFHTIPYNALPIPDQATADMLNAGYFQLNQMIKAAGSTDTIHFTVGPNPLVIQASDPQHPWGMRQVKSTEFVLMSLPQDSLKCAGWGSMKPIPGNFILDETEIENVKNAVNDYNEIIAQLVSGKDIALVDMYSTMKQICMDGMVFDGVEIDSRFVQGNFYSLDGLNPTPRGSAVVARYFIGAINTKFGANIPQVVVSDYDGVVFP